MACYGGSLLHSPAINSLSSVMSAFELWVRVALCGGKGGGGKLRNSGGEEKHLKVMWQYLP